MIRYFLFFVLFLTSTLFSIIWGQGKNTNPCSTVEYKQFDFWLGNWDVYNTDGKLIGTNLIKQMPNACAIQENWVSKSSKSKGTSYNYYNKTDNTWNQVWIDNTGFSLNLKGSYKNNAMILNSELINSEKGKYYNQIIWKKNADNSITQTWNYINEDHKKIKEVFKGIYKKHKN